MIELGFAEEAAHELPELIDSSLNIENPVSRLEALFLLFEAVFPLDGARHLTLESLIRACQAADSWKAGDRLRESALMLASNYPSEAEQVIRAMPEGKYKRQATQRIAASEYREPRDFFW